MQVRLLSDTQPSDAYAAGVTSSPSGTPPPITRRTFAEGVAVLLLFLSDRLAEQQPISSEGWSPDDLSGKPHDAIPMPGRKRLGAPALERGHFRTLAGEIPLECRIASPRRISKFVK